MITRLRRLARRGGIFGLAAASLYVLLRGRAGWLVLAAAAAGGILWFRAPKPEFISQFTREKSPVYDLVDLGTHGQGVAVTALNNNGDAAGVVLLNEDTIHAAVWIDGHMKDIGTLRGDVSIATDINDRGEVVGLSESGPESFFGFRWTRGKMTPLPSLNKKLSAASAINQRGDIAGVSTSDSAPLIACAWDGGKAHSLPMPRGFSASFAEDINGRGILVGFAVDNSGERARAVRWEARRVGVLQTLGGKNSVAVSLNESGTIGGASNIRGGNEREWTAALWQAGRIRDIGRLPGAQWGVVNSINRRGEIVGASGAGCGTSRACIWVDEKPHDLNNWVDARGWHLLSAAAINDRGQIAGTAIHNDQIHGFILNPRNQSAVAPASEALDWNTSHLPVDGHGRHRCLMASGAPKLQLSDCFGAHLRTLGLHPWTHSLIWRPSP